MPSVYVKTLGCKVNTFDSHALANQFRDKGYHLTDSAEDADVTVVNTCSVTQNADKEARYLARRFRRESPDTVLVFTGCYAQTDSQRLVEMGEVDFVIPNEAKDRLVGIVDEGLELRRAGAWPEGRSKLPAGVGAVKDNKQSHFKSSVTFFDKAESEQTRAFVKVQDGCDGFCTYCLIPYARGSSRSVPSSRVVEEIKRLLDTGCPEIVLTGIHIGDYGRDQATEHQTDHPIVGLVSQILDLPGLKRLRISSLEPRELSPALAELMGAHKHVVCDHMHLPLQSGSDRILKAMRRSYDKAGYTEAVMRFRRFFPDASIGADVIPGFPGETAEEFEETYRLVQDLELSYLHVFPYSKRPNTAAARMPGHLAGDVVKDRAARLRALSRDLAERFARRHIGRTLPVLWEKDVDAQGRRLGHTMNYLTVVAPGGALQPDPGQISPAVLKGFVEQGRILVRTLS